MIQTQRPVAYPSADPISPYERPPGRFEHRTTTTTTRNNPQQSLSGKPRATGELVKSWEAFDRLFDQAFAPSTYAAATRASTFVDPDDDDATEIFDQPRGRSNKAPGQRSSSGSYYRDPVETPRPKSKGKGKARASTSPAKPETEYSTEYNGTLGTKRGHKYHVQDSFFTQQTPSQAQTGISGDYDDLYDDGESQGDMMSQTDILPGGYPSAYPLPDTPYHAQAPRNPFLSSYPSQAYNEPYSSVEANEDFQKLWDEAAENKRKRMTRTVTRRRILQHGVMSPTASVSTVMAAGKEEKPAETEASKAVRRKKSRFHLYRNGDADTMTATFDLPDVQKEDVHVAFQTDQLTITWESNIVTERREPDGKTIVRERKERKYARTLPLPQGTEFPDIKAYLENGVLTVMYPKFPKGSRAMRIISNN